MIDPSGNGAADGYIGTCPQSAQQRSQSGMEHHKETSLVLTGKNKQAAVQLRADLQGDRVSPVTGNSPPGPVDWQLKLLRQALQGLGPESDLAPQRALRISLAAQKLLLPQRVIGVLDSQCRQLGLRTLGARGVGPRQVAAQRPQRPAVSGDVVQH